ncbi:MAG: 16S rRNA (adenine(1518)-N(6)/adenine(1519)-N(6))-dimethyltransferase RsmA [Armatimonadota bacterium]
MDLNLTAPSTVAKILAKHGVRPRKSLGQSFLIDRNVLDRIVTSAQLTKDDLVLEIGAGIGVLTRALSPAAGHVVSIEVDPIMLRILSETTSDLPNVRIVPGDVLKLDLAQLLVDEGGPPAKVVANLPYCITTPAITKLLSLTPPSTGLSQAPLITVMVFLVQKEVALRLSAPPGSENYGSLSVLVQYHCEVDVVSTISRRVFMPSPKVDSAIVRLSMRSRPAANVQDERLFFSIVRASFGQRRKTLVNALATLPALDHSKSLVSDVLSRAGIDPSRRGETLSIAEFASIANTVSDLRRLA